MHLDQATRIGQDALIFLAGRAELLDACLVQSGLAPDELRGRASEPAFLGFLLEFLLQSDAWVEDFAAEAGLRPEDVARARAVLDGGLPHWT
ncbi:hypothetical protein HNP73_001165 [Amaricoccus macauensis]|jgi:hypothetical protein|uniref:DUF3572 family protein n=1 Tax=Amaricoccus macauensis TaxID=57001 RepID=A0A840SJV8_9RHOB|nr:DUF3572 family protein [Amaricoccus macauensis]MBB5221244.1 hypothetical protein [Amaricoccus macauensis]